MQDVEELFETAASGFDSAPEITDALNHQLLKLVDLGLLAIELGDEFLHLRPSDALPNAVLGERAPKACAQRQVLAHLDHSEQHLRGIKEEVALTNTTSSRDSSPVQIRLELIVLIRRGHQRHLEVIRE
ncbi:hypothetical protein SNOD_25120 [Streptomyces nodosus]|uniref:Uncharacterized protein n=1 Tax=Streptomyces nodosus TaxID=40318 RepID=A0A0B5DQV7_9ACTN|nr:hypothetical protein SNOD_25120 [Streptomyces nodosus]